jgi:hypothetical protein
MVNHRAVGSEKMSSFIGFYPIYAFEISYPKVN